MRDRREREPSSAELTAFNMGMQLFQEPTIKARRHRREVHIYPDHRIVIEEITEEY